MLAAEQHVQQHAERVDIGRRGDLPAGQLLRRRVLGRERRAALSRQSGRLGRQRSAGLGIALEQLGNAEVEQLDLAVDR